MSGSLAQPSSPHAAELAAWSFGGATQSPVDQLLAEHYLMDVAMCAIAREANTLGQRAPLRVDFWRDAIDFIGNYVHQVHRRKEEQAMFPALSVVGLAGLEREVDATIDEHQRVRQLTLDLVSGADDGDWERVFRSVGVYLAVLGPHVAREERAFLIPMRTRLAPETNAVLSEHFRRIETEALGLRGRRHYLAAVNRIAESTGLRGVLGG